MKYWKTYQGMDLSSQQIIKQNALFQAITQTPITYVQRKEYDMKYWKIYQGMDLSSQHIVKQNVLFQAITEHLSRTIHILVGNLDWYQDEQQVLYGLFEASLMKRVKCSSNFYMKFRRNEITILLVSPYIFLAKTFQSQKLLLQHQISKFH